MTHPEAGPLAGVRVLVTRAAQQAEAFTGQLTALGASVVAIPTITVRPEIDGARLHAAIQRLRETRLIVFTSANAVRIFVDLLEAAHQDHLLAGCHLCAIGSETARALMDRGQQPDLIAGEYTAEGLVTALAGFDLAGARVLIPRAAAGRDVLPQLLAQAGADVEVLTLYRTVVPATAGEELRRLFASGGVDVVTFTSSSTVMNFVAALGGGAPPRSQIGSALVACMGPVTAQTSAELGLAPDVVAQEYTTAGLTGAIVRAVADRLGSR